MAEPLEPQGEDGGLPSGAACEWQWLHCTSCCCGHDHEKHFEKSLPFAMSQARMLCEKAWQPPLGSLDVLQRQPTLLDHARQNFTGSTIHKMFHCSLTAKSQGALLIFHEMSHAALFEYGS